MKPRLPRHHNRTFRLSLQQRWAGAFALLALVPLVLGGCGGGDDNEPLNTSSRSNSLSSLFRATVSVGSSSFPDTAKYDCWVASRPSQRDEGFSYISSSEIPAGRGMVVVYPQNRTVAFAGRNTLVDLEVVFAESVGEGVGRITDIGTISAFQRTPVGASKPVKYVLFVPSGDLARSNAAVGTLLFVPVTTPRN
ncbi:MAG: DUF192 domain-containing protein [Fibrella sp.]|nr:DUF192 domain-containing protein [Armatimonadota bacterium]